MRGTLLASLGMLSLLGIGLAACGGDDGEQQAASVPQSPVAEEAGAGSGTTPVIDPGDGGNYHPEIDAANFVARIDNPFLPFAPGSLWVYESTDGVERIEVEVLPETREILGIAATIVRDRVWEEGELIEDTFDWYAQDRAGNVWYLGEDSKEFEDGEVVSTGGSWEAGVDGAHPGIIMQAVPAIGQSYRQEYYAGEAEDLARVLQLTGAETVAFGSFDDLLVIQEWTPLESDVIENKYFAPGVGPVLELKVAGETGRVELVSFEPAE